MLTKEEMEIFDEDFKHFAIANGVDNDAWMKLVTEDQEKATKLVEIFSDTVLQKVYEKLKFIEHRTKESCMVFKLNRDNIEMISINSKSEKADLSTPESIHDAMVKSPEELTFFETTKAYNKTREDEIHQMLESGCFNSSEAFWIMLKKALKTD